jgi:hypothetical protein
MHAVHGRRRVDLGWRQPGKLGHVVCDDGCDREDDELAPHGVGGRQRGRDVGHRVGRHHKLDLVRVRLRLRVGVKVRVRVRVKVRV